MDIFSKFHPLFFSFLCSTEYVRSHRGCGGIQIRRYHSLCAEHTAAIRLYSVRVHYLQLTKSRDDPIAICYQNTRLVEVEEGKKKPRGEMIYPMRREGGVGQNRLPSTLSYLFFSFLQPFYDCV